MVDAELKKADVVCLVYDVSRPETFARVESFWLPRIRDATASKAAQVGDVGARLSNCNTETPPRHDAKDACCIGWQQNRLAVRAVH
jgi:hypothetical protein